MPYIDKERQHQLDHEQALITESGDLAYVITREALSCNYQSPESVKAFSRCALAAVDMFLPMKPRFADYAAVMGVLSCVNQELYRRGAFPQADIVANFEESYYLTHVAPYEDKKIAENGDVFA